MLSDIEFRLEQLVVNVRDHERHPAFRPYSKWWLAGTTAVSQTIPKVACTTTVWEQIGVTEAAAKKLVSAQWKSKKTAPYSSFEYVRWNNCAFVTVKKVLGVCQCCMGKYCEYGDESQVPADPERLVTDQVVTRMLLRDIEFAAACRTRHLPPPPIEPAINVAVTKVSDKMSAVAPTTVVPRNATTEAEAAAEATTEAAAEATSTSATISNQPLSATPAFSSFMMAPQPLTKLEAQKAELERVLATLQAVRKDSRAMADPAVLSSLKHIAHESMAALRGKQMKNTVELNPVTGGAPSTWQRVRKSFGGNSARTLRAVKQSLGEHVKIATGIPNREVDLQSWLPSSLKDPTSSSPAHKRPKH